jgi:hypothetical protein
MTTFKSTTTGRVCHSSIILSPPNGNVKMSPHERKDVRVESEGTATSQCDLELCEGRPGVCQSRRTALAEQPTGQASQAAPPPGAPPPPINWTHLLLCPPACRQPRQRRAVAGRPLADPVPGPTASASPPPKSTSIRLSTDGSRSIPEIPNCSTPWLPQSDTFMSPLG